ncbi:MAG: amidohydrolase [Armatimonadetes bacterium]|nr:amidohydrolase [Armatimonadota bacterium]
MNLHLDPDIESLRPALTATRRDFHAHPELGYHETRTAGIVAQRLQSLGIDVRSGVAETGVIGLLRGGAPGKTVLVRADMDALPLQEENEVDYKSQDPGVMHACGHDGHTAMLLAVAEALSRRKGELRGNVKLLFQPAEEGGAGARRMIEEGALEDPSVDFALACHLWNDSEVGCLHVREGAILACADRFDIKLRGKGGHAAHPDVTVDPIIIASEVTLAFQTILSRNLSPLHPGVVSVTSFHGGTTYNIIPEEVSLGGTVRAFDLAVRDRIRERMQQILEGISRAYGGTFKFDYQSGYPPTINDPEMVEFVRGVAKEVVPPELVTVNEPSMGGEDMSYILQQVPGCMFLVGSAKAERGLDQPHHNPRFDFDEEALVIGASVMTRAVRKLLAAGP